MEQENMKKNRFGPTMGPNRAALEQSTMRCFGCSTNWLYADLGQRIAWAGWVAVRVRFECLTESLCPVCKTVAVREEAFLAPPRGRA